jgi:hypothetical protein
MLTSLSFSQETKSYKCQLTTELITTEKCFNRRVNGALEFGDSVYNDVRKLRVPWRIEQQLNNKDLERKYLSTRSSVIKYFHRTN